MMRWHTLWSVALSALLLIAPLAGPAPAEDDAVFSGPQVGEKLPGFKAQGAFGDLDGKQFDPVADAGGKPVVIVFVHARTRPAFALTNKLMAFAATRRADGLRPAIVFLPEDATETSQWLKQIQTYFPQGVPVGISVDGQEGPGAYGLNRNVTLTVLVGKDNQVTANFALVQPSLQADGVKIAEQIVKVLGSGKVPTLEELDSNPVGRAGRPQIDDPMAERLLRAVIRPDATPEEVGQAAERLQEYLSQNERAKAAVTRIARNLVASDRVKTLGTPAAREWIEKWAK